MDKIAKNRKINIIIFLLISLTFYSQSVFKKKDFIKVVVNKNWNKDSLEKNKKRLEKLNIKFDYSNVIYDKNKKISKFKLTVNTNDGYSGYSDFYGPMDGFDFGFYRDYGYFASKNFEVGYLKK